MFKKVLLILFLFLIFPQKTFAALYINEFASDTTATTTDPDWVEIYNSGPDSVDLSLYRLRDKATNKKDLAGTIAASSFAPFDWFNRLDKAGDIIKLVLIADENTILDQVAYGDSDSDVSAPGVGQSAGRQTDGLSTWVIFNTPTKNSTNNTSTPAPTLTPTPTATPTPSPSTNIQTTTTSTPKTPTPVATSVSVSLVNDEEVTESSILSESTPSSKLENNEPKPSPVETQVAAENNFQKILIGVGILFIISSGFWFIRSLKSKSEQNE